MNSISRKIIDARQIVAQMTLEEKASLLSGEAFWYTKAVERLDIPSVMLTDGPHGLRKQGGAADHLGLNDSVPATCFPTAATTACAFDRSLMTEMGIALGEECLANDVAVLLGPAVNIKRSPLCGRNFEYVSEDPYLAGEAASALIEGVQSKNIGVSVKHYLANSQEKRRMTSDSVIDERALHEIYMPAFEATVKKAQPWTIMCSYNKINGVYASDNKELMEDTLRGKWGYEGLLVTDWGAMNDRVQAVKAGLDLEMPSTGGCNDRDIVAAVKKGVLKESEVDALAERVTALALAHKENTVTEFDAVAHDELARRIARESAVLLKNEGVLPFAKDKKVAVVGAFAKNPRYQGAGSSKINPLKITSVIDEFTQKGIDFVYAEGYDLDSDIPNEDKIREAVTAVAECDNVLLFVGLPDAYESEGFDRSYLDMPLSHIKLIDRLAETGKKLTVVLEQGSPIVMPWIDKTSAVLLMYLSGQNNGGAVYDLVFGDYSPSGKLAETFPLKLMDNPSFENYAKDSNIVEYRESIYVGYRFYDKAKKEVLFPFGYGLSYTDFEYSDITVDKTAFDHDTDTIKVSCKVKNIGTVKAKEIVELYVKAPISALFRPIRELKGYEKIELDVGEEKTVYFNLDKRSFAYYNVNIHDFAVEGGAYSIEIGASSRDIRLETTVKVAGDDVKIPDYNALAPFYYDLDSETTSFPKEQFEAVLGHKVPEEPRARPFTINSTIREIKKSCLGRILASYAEKEMRKAFKDMAGDDLEAMVKAMLYDMPLRSLCMGSGGKVSYNQLRAIASLLNWNVIKAICYLRRK